MTVDAKDGHADTEVVEGRVKFGAAPCYMVRE